MSCRVSCRQGSTRKPNFCCLNAEPAIRESTAIPIGMVVIDDIPTRPPAATRLTTDGCDSLRKIARKGNRLAKSSGTHENNGETATERVALIAAVQTN